MAGAFLIRLISQGVVQLKRTEGRRFALKHDLRSVYLTATEEEKCPECGTERLPRDPKEVAVAISTGYSVGDYASCHGFPQKGEHFVHDEFTSVLENVMSHRLRVATPIRRTARIRQVTGEEWSEEDLRKLRKLTPEELASAEGDIPRICEHVTLGNCYYEVVDVVWRKVYRPGPLPDTQQLGIVPEVYLRRVDCDEWSEAVSEELRSAGAASWGP